MSKDANSSWETKADAFKQKIIQHIQDNGPMPFSQYMEACLYDTEFGYYRSRTNPIGHDGDFITAPTLSPLFSYCIARQWQDIALQLPQCGLLEIGAGNGQMASDILQYLKQSQTLPDYYHILETSALLKETQYNQIKNDHPDLIDRIVWIEDWPKQFHGVIVGNEVLDAMPIERIRYNDGWEREYVTFHKDHTLGYSYETSEIINQLDTLQTIPKIKGYQTEISLLIPAWIQAASQCLQRGLLLLIDYGYPAHEFYHAERSQGTLMCHHRHKTNQDPLWLPSCQDITSHVNFTQVAEVAMKSGFDLLGYTHQAGFLMNLGITEIPLPHEEKAAYQASQGLKHLVMPQEMGEKFKALGLGKAIQPPLKGFTHLDQRHLLFQKK